MTKISITLSLSYENETSRYETYVALVLIRKICTVFIMAYVHEMHIVHWIVILEDPASRIPLKVSHYTLGKPNFSK